MTEITLTWHEVNFAAVAGCQRVVQALARSRPTSYGMDERKVGGGWEYHVEGACAELVVAKATDSYWEPVWYRIDAERDDIEGWQVRSTTRPDGCLIVHNADPSNARFVLVVGTAPTYRIVGWIYGHEALQSKWWRTDTGRPAYFVPQSALHPFPAVVATV